VIPWRRKKEQPETLAELWKAAENLHSGQGKRGPDSRILKRFWIPAFAGMMECAIFA
jgi:hypothetical protein